MVGKIVYAFTLLLRLGYIAATAAGVALVADVMWRRSYGHGLDWGGFAEARALRGRWRLQKFLSRSCLSAEFCFV
jgi:hypothetical protein